MLFRQIAWRSRRNLRAASKYARDCSTLAGAQEPPPVLRLGSLSSSHSLSDQDISKNEARINQDEIENLHSQQQSAITSRARLEELVEQLEIEQKKRYVADVEYVRLLQACPKLKALDVARRLHSQIVRASLDNRVFLGNHLIHTYGKCHSLDDAWETFERMSYKNVYTWTAIIGVCAQHHCHSLAIILLRQMLLEGVKPDNITLLAALTSCETSQALPAGKLIHGLIAQSGHQCDLILENALVSMYGSCGSVDDAKRVFDAMPARNVITWTAMIGAHAETSLEQAFKVFRLMELEGFKSNFVTYVTLVQACSKPEFLEVGIILHMRSVESSSAMETPLCNALITMYGRCGRLEDARAIFSSMVERDIIAWNALITEYGQHGHVEEAVLLYQLMLQEGCKPDKVTFVALLTMSNGPEALTDVKLVHSHIVESGVSINIALGTALVAMYSKCESLEDTRWLFEKMPQRNVISWNVMVTAYAKHGLGRKAVQITEYMQLDGVKPDNVTCVGLLNVCTGSADLKLGRKVHGWIAEGRCEADLILWNSLLNMYGRCGEVEQAEMVFDGILQRNVISWTAMLTAYSRQNRQDMALLLFHAIHLSGVKPTCITFLEALDACVGAEALDKGRLVHCCAVQSGNGTDVSLGSALVAMYGRCGSIRDAKACFDDTEVRKNHVTWSAMIAAFVQDGQDREGLQHLRFMQQQGLDMSPATFASTLSACSNLADLREGKRIHSYVRERRFDTEAATVTNSLVTMYGKCGNLDCAREVFETSRRQDIICWNAIISGYAQHGQTRDAVELFHRMQQEGITPDPVTFVCILSVCSHGGLLDEGVYAYASMVELGLEPTQDNYACVIDLLGRAGKLQEAEDFIQSLGTRPAIETLTSLLSSCKSHGDVQRGRRAAEGIMEMDPRSSSAHVVLSSIYSADPEE